jgi:hypothetical protein
MVKKSFGDRIVSIELPKGIDIRRLGIHFVSPTKKTQQLAILTVNPLLRKESWIFPISGGISAM